jgi:MOSC domain-containing protein YiiM
MHNSVTHITAAELEQGLAEVLASPCDHGRLAAIYVRPAVNERTAIKQAMLSPEGGIEGDRWLNDSYYKTDDGRPDRRSQVSLMNSRFLRQVAGDDESMCLAGDNLIVDFDLSEENLPGGTVLRIGAEVVLEISDLPHTGCSKLARRYGDAARSFMNNKRGKALHLRGRYAAILQGGTLQIGDRIEKIDSTARGQMELPLDS